MQIYRSDVNLMPAFVVIGMHMVLLSAKRNIKEHEICGLVSHDFQTVKSLTRVRELTNETVGRLIIKKSNSFR
jgi:hypothetical protein